MMAQLLSTCEIHSDVLTFVEEVLLRQSINLSVLHVTETINSPVFADTLGIK